MFGIGNLMPSAGWKPEPSDAEKLAVALRLAKEATSGWACYATRKIEHDEIARLHREIATLEGK